MKVSDLLVSRRANWQELEELCTRMENSFRPRLDARAAARFTALYRSTCADLALADGYQLPPGTTQYLHLLVGRAHNQLYRSRLLDWRPWWRVLFVQGPQSLFRDRAFRLALCLFWGTFLISALLAWSSPGFAERVMTKEKIQELEEMYAEPIGEGRGGVSMGMVGFYISNNAGIGLRCFAAGLIFGVGGLFITLFNAAFLGAAFGHMATAPQRDHFFHFVTAHGPFELTAIVLCAAAGMRLGFSLVDTRGLTREASLRKAAVESVPVMALAVVLFVLAALIEGLLSPSSAPYWVKAAVAVISTLLLLFYICVLGYPRGK